MLLVRAAVLEDERGADAWERWAADATQQEIEVGEMRLLAAAYRSLDERGVEGPMLDVARGIYRRTWYVNQLTVSRNARIAARLEEAGIPVLFLKGFALAIQSYRDLGARPMEDLDLLVPPGEVGAAARALEPLGLEPMAGSRGGAGLLATELQVADGNGDVVEIHAYALIESADDSDLWERPAAFALRDAEAFAPDPADHLLLVCVHGQRWNTTQPVSWIVDAAAIVRSAGGALDWDRFVERARARELTLVAARAARMLRSLDVDVPAGVAAQLESQRPGVRLRVADRAGRAVPNRLTTLILGHDRYRRFRTLAPAEHRPDGPLDWIAGRWGASGTGDLLGQAGDRVLALERSLRARGE